jgi:hypothetical protein
MGGKNWGIVLSFIAGAVALGCSVTATGGSSDGGATPGDASSQGDDGGSPEAGPYEAGSHPPPDAGMSSDGQADAPVDDGQAANDAPPTCPTPIPVDPRYVGGLIPPYQRPGSCTAAQIANFIQECVTAPSPQCQRDWPSDYYSTGCVGCINPTYAIGGPTGTGPIYQWIGDAITLNTAGCIALVDPTGGMACGDAYQRLANCVSNACYDCAGASDALIQQCGTNAVALSATCYSYWQTYNSACSADLADGGIGTRLCSDPTSIVTEYCGGSGDGG